MADKPSTDPLAPGHIPGQNPATPERLPKHTAYYDEGGVRPPDRKPDATAPAKSWGGIAWASSLVAAIIVAAVLAIWLLPAATEHPSSPASETSAP
jgi:hypothetical protein